MYKSFTIDHANENNFTYQRQELRSDQLFLKVDLIMSVVASFKVINFNRGDLELERKLWSFCS